MKKLLIILFVTGIGAVLQAQVTDSKIATDLLGKSLHEITPTLDAFNVFYFTHAPKKPDAEKRIYSIANSKGVVKVYSVMLSKGVVETVRINFRHDDMGQLLDLKEITGATRTNVGVHSTDVFFELK